MESLVRVALENLAKNRAVEGVVPRLLLGYLAQNGGELRLILGNDLSRLTVRELGGPLLYRGIGEDPVRIPVPFGVEPSPKVFELHLLELPLLQQTGIPGVVVEHLAVPVFLGGPQIVPAPPEAVVSQIHRKQPVKVRETFFSQEIQRQRCSGRIRNAGCSGPQVG